MRVRVNHDEESHCSSPDFNARHQHSVRAPGIWDQKAALKFLVIPFPETRL